MIKEIYLQKAAVPRRALAASTLREAMAIWGTDRLLNIVKSCEEAEDAYRIEYGRIHKRYANITFLISETMTEENLQYTAETLLHWLVEDFKDALTGAQKDSAGVCAAELRVLIEKFRSEENAENGPPTPVPPVLKGAELYGRSPTFRKAAKRSTQYRKLPPENEDEQ